MADTPASSSAYGNNPMVIDMAIADWISREMGQELGGSRSGGPRT